jgi:hypothetical protein
MLTSLAQSGSMVRIMSFNAVKQFVIILLGLQGLCFIMVEATEQ